MSSNLVHFNTRADTQAQPASNRADVSLHRIGTHLNGPVWPEPLQALVAQLKPHPLHVPMQHIFGDLLRLLSYLRLIEQNVRQDRLLVATLSVFLRVQAEARALLEFIGGETQRLANVDETLAGALDGVQYALGHELKRVFEVELVGLDELRQTSAIRARLEHAHGLLCNSLRQSLVVLAQVFEPALTGEHLFDDLMLRRKQSWELYQALERLLQSARRVEAQGGRAVPALLLAQLGRFRDEHMCLLMYRDWQEYESFLTELAAAGDEFELGTILNSLTCYLETLLSQVRLRSSLSDYFVDDQQTAYLNNF